jgi:putative SOS response-associated peptidase YedK
MCGRYSLHSNPRVVALQFGLDALPPFAPRYNIAPAANALIVRAQGAALAHWGLKGSMHNARAETLAVKLSFREAYHRRRCLIPANGFYEWKREGALKQPYYIRPAERELFAFAGLWERWQGLETFSVITVEANFAMRAIHDRMPVIIAPEHYAGWLHGEEGLLRPAPHSALRSYPVSAAVNRAANESADLIEPLESEIQKSLFN